MPAIITAARCAVAVTPNDGADVVANQVMRGIAFATAGAISLIMEDGNIVTIPSGVLAEGLIHPLGFTRVRATGTTATNIWAFY